MILSPYQRKGILTALAGCFVAEIVVASFIYALMPAASRGFWPVAALLAANAALFLWVALKLRANLTSNEGLLPFILNDLNDGIFDYDLVTNKISYSKSYIAMLGYGGEEFGTDQDNFYNYVHPDDLDSAVTHMKRYLSQEIPTYHNTFRVRHKEGHWVWVMSRGIGLRNETGKFYRLIGTHTDITVQKQREEDLKRLFAENETQKVELLAEKVKAESANRAKTEFLATMSHEIRTPMNAVTGLSELMLRTKLDARQTEMMETLHANTSILLRLVNNIMDLERIELGQIDFEMHPFNMEDIFDNMRTMFAGQAELKGITFKMMNGLGAMPFIGDRARLEQILINLVGNALKFTLEGEITLSAQAASRNDKGVTALITVADTGVGIPAEKLPTIFERFVQADQSISRRFGGSGLGLAISRSLARLMKGDITVESQPGQGSRFTVTMPLLSGKARVLAPAGRQPEGKTPEGSTILLVEDYAPNVLVATIMLESLNYTVEVAGSGAEAIAKIESRAAPYVVVLMDVQMHGMDGYETTRRVRALEAAKGFHNHIIGVTANALVGDREKCLDAGMDDYMSKPISADILRQKISGAATRAA